jgi:hypothetical protein
MPHEQDSFFYALVMFHVKKMIHMLSFSTKSVKIRNFKFHSLLTYLHFFIFLFEHWSKHLEML